ncbi:MAG: hypothetical protein ACLQUY_12575 [Ktedonobacterales bacterium]
MASQFLTTSRLNNIISMIVLGRQSGILRVVRGQGSTRELGQIQFVDGTAVSALLGRLTGGNALSVLQNWGECVYSFDENPVPEAASLANPDSMNYYAGSPAYEGSQPTLDPASSFQPGGSWPTYGAMNSQPNPSPLPPSSSFGNSFPRAGSQPGFTPVPSGRYTGDMPDFDAMYGEMQPAPSQRTGYPSTASLGPGVLALCPRRTSLSENVDQLPLDRRERMVLLLIDGRRNLSDLARLTRRTEHEIFRVIEHLSGLGLIQLNY